MKVKTMIMIAAICFAVIPMIVYSVLTNFLVGQDADNRFRSELRSMVQNQTSSLQTLLDMSKSDLNTLASYPAVNNSAERGVKTDEADEFISRFMGDNSYLNDISIVDMDGNVIIGKNAGKALENFASYSDYKDDVLYFDELKGSTGSNATMFIKRQVGKIGRAHV